MGKSLSSRMLFSQIPNQCHSLAPTATESWESPSWSISHLNICYRLPHRFSRFAIVVGLKTGKPALVVSPLGLPTLQRFSHQSSDVCPTCIASKKAYRWWLSAARNRLILLGLFLLPFDFLPSFDLLTQHRRPQRPNVSSTSRGSKKMYQRALAAQNCLMFLWL